MGKCDLSEKSPNGSTQYLVRAEDGLRNPVRLERALTGYCTYELGRGDIGTGDKS